MQTIWWLLGDIVCMAIQKQKSLKITFAIIKCPTCCFEDILLLVELFQTKLKVLDKKNKKTNHDFKNFITIINIKFFQLNFGMLNNK
ncbi:hypothetical protein BpHYR1_053430 [Brachionus plicatilis]|uniref:Uncharacterized protein n=1 Tax=Brachionus plicatilis TaxID=10195 RepID=A0A3M7QIS6_BRAPC|nr:hypothetical protein BpHYR1_053430 [Brachionus plicatilis]